MLMTSPMLIAVYWVAVLSVVGFLAAGAYIPLFRMYSDGCAQSQIVADDLVDGGVEVATGGGTPLARNTYSVAFNYATSQGNRDRLDGLERMEAERFLGASVVHLQGSISDEKRWLLGYYKMIFKS